MRQQLRASLGNYLNSLEEEFGEKAEEFVDKVRDERVVKILKYKLAKPITNTP
jgi:hypothetical protein